MTRHFVLWRGPGSVYTRGMTKHSLWVVAASFWALAGCGATSSSPAGETGAAASGAACACEHCEGKGGACEHADCQAAECQGKGGACAHADCEGKGGACDHADCEGKGGACDHHGPGGGDGSTCEHCNGGKGPEGKACGCKHGKGHGHGPGHGPGHATGEGHGHHPAMPAPVAAFHAELRPVWHAPANREALACEKVSVFTARGADLSGMALTGDADAARTALVTAVADLSAACAATPRAGVDAKLEAAHTAFHRLMELTTPGAGGGEGHSCGGKK